MEEQYSFKDKKKALALYIDSLQSKSYSVKEYKNIKIKTNSNFCLYCENGIETGLFCSKICYLIFHSNNTYLEERTRCIRFPPFELIEEKEEFRKFVSVNKDFEQMHINYSLVKDKWVGHFKFIENFDFVKITTPVFSLALTESDQCLYCKINKPVMTIKLTNDRELLGLCSLFCSYSFKSYIEGFVNNVFKSFHFLPHASIIEDKNIIQLLKEEDSKTSVYSVERMSKDIIKINKTTY